MVSNQDAEKTIKEIFIPTPPKEEPAQEKKVEPEPKASKAAEASQVPKPRPAEKQEKIEEKPEKPSGPLMEKLAGIFQEKDIDIIESKIIRKSDIELMIKVPSPVGKLTYFCKAVDKKKINDKDLSSVFVQSQMKKLPALFVTTGQLSKKAKEMLDKEFKIISVLNI
jgi:hypothetical protein